jgi:hypothetical protein
MTRLRRSPAAMPHRALVGAASFPQGEWWWSTGVGRAARVGATAGVGDFERGVGQELGVPAGGVEEVVVAGADEHDVPRTLQTCPYGRITDQSHLTAEGKRFLRRLCRAAGNSSTMAPSTCSFTPSRASRLRTACPW